MYASLAYIFHNNKIIGYCCTSNEADDICKNNFNLEWDYAFKNNKINKEKIKKIIDTQPQLTIHSFKK